MQAREEAIARRTPAATVATGLSLLRLGVPARLAIAAVTVLLLWLCMAWALA